MLATPVKEPFDHPDWIFEVKWDGYRAVAEIRDEVRFALFPERDLVQQKVLSYCGSASEIRI